MVKKGKEPSNKYPDRICQQSKVLPTRQERVNALKIEDCATCCPHCSSSCKCKPKECYRPFYHGRCSALLTRWYYDRERNKCQQFVYGGCDSNHNNFLSKDACKRLCLDDLLQMIKL